MKGSFLKQSKTIPSSNMVGQLDLADPSLFCLYQNEGDIDIHLVEI